MFFIITPLIPLVRGTPPHPCPDISRGLPLSLIRRGARGEVSSPDKGRSGGVVFIKTLF
jgi:hypothetical protein